MKEHTLYITEVKQSLLEQ